MARVLYVGVDWADDHHDIYLTDEAAGKLEAFRVAQAQPARASSTPPQTKCFTTQAEALTGLIFAGTQQQVSRDVRDQIPNLPPLVFAGAGQPYCAAMLVSSYTMSVKAACFATLQERIDATAAW